MDVCVCGFLWGGASVLGNEGSPRTALGQLGITKDLCCVQSRCQCIFKRPQNRENIKFRFPPIAELLEKMSCIDPLRLPIIVRCFVLTFPQDT